MVRHWHKNYVYRRPADYQKLKRLRQEREAWRLVTIAAGDESEDYPHYPLIPAIMSQGHYVGGTIG